MKIWFRNVWPPLVAVLFFLTLWQVAVQLLHLDTWFLPGPLDIGHEALTNQENLITQSLATLQLTLVGLLIGIAVGLSIALILHFSPLLKSALYPLMILSQNIPTIALAPLLLVWFGYGLLPKYIVITLVCFFPVAVSAMDGLTRTDPMMRNYMQMIGASRGQIFRKLEFPHALPAIMSGVKIAATYSVMGAIIAEWIGADKGIGYYMMMQRSSFRTDRIFVAIMIIVLMSLTLFTIVVLIEKWLVRYQPQAQADQK
ncbi:ABC-type nitrate/sulfonate/bicarbonate transport system permease component [Paenibacillus shirakamiensis]|uniref:ABC-type nitrate/sulfonate/bicarbonate transport system permease component n=1 Tax=Paenibacillus shirakamiensis TaxID=1265935 RepID=A0ABS4JKJ5_9BACL|nr:ABC transporter permease [Paenibacillus shirakamiensis]MBP2001595.1 ABC-type nitrate/sulfonate/bicarbonate transport system permease component [Paenibacillus shirakamiensis]